MDDNARATQVLATEGAALIHKFELQAEESIATAAELAAFFARARRDSSVSPTFGQALFDHTAQLMTLAVQTRAVSVNLHNSAEAATRKLGITMGPPNLNKPDQQPTPMLSVVPETASIRVAEGVQGGVITKQIESYKDLLKRAVERLTALGMEPIARLVMGEPTPAIAQIAKDDGADLVVVGHRDRDLLSRWWSGSSQAYLTDHVKCSVLIARSDITDAAFEAELTNTNRL